jgi:hypothetical protein
VGSGTVRWPTPGKGGRKPLDSEDVSPSASEPDSASLRSTVVANPPDMAKPAICGYDPRSRKDRRTTRGGWGGRVSKDQPRNLGGPVGGVRSRGEAKTGALWSPVAACGDKDVSGSTRVPQSEPLDLMQHQWGIHNPDGALSRDSERPIVVRKRSNVRGAKGPYFSRVSIKGGRAA